MGCLKMDISDQYFTALKVVKETSRSGENTRAGGYRFGFNGQEKLDEITGVTGSHLSFKYRIYDSRIAKFLSIDPLFKDYPHWTPYQFAGLTPIWAKELEGLEAWYTSTGDTDPDGPTGPRKEQAGPLTKEYAQEQGYVEYGVSEEQLDNSFTDEEVQEFSDWNEESGPTEPGYCLGCAITGSEILTGADAGFRNLSGNNVLDNSTVYDLGENLEETNNAVELNASQGQETNAALQSSNSQDIENSAFLLGPAGGYHSMIAIYNTATQEFSLYDQGTGWDVKNASQQNAQNQIDDINSINSDWGTRIWQLYNLK